MEYIWGNSSHETPRQQLDIMLTYRDCPFDHSLNIPHDCINDLETCGLFEPSGPSGCPRSLVCAACHYPRSLHRSITSTPLHHILARSPVRPYNPAFLSPPGPYYPAHRGEASTSVAPQMTRSARQTYPAHRGEASTSVAPQMTRSPPQTYPAHRGEASTSLAPEMTNSPLPCPPPASEPAPAERQRVKKLTPDGRKRLKEIAKEHDYCALKEYTKAEAQQICAELCIKKKCLSDWISRHNLKRKRAAKEEAAREAAAKEEADREEAAT